MFGSNSKKELQDAIIWLDSLLGAGCNEEAAYQEYFENNSVTFGVLGYEEAIPLTQGSHRSLPRDSYSGLKPEPDFLARREDGIWEIFELKTPFLGSVILDRSVYRQRLSAKIQEYISQTVTYDEYFTRNPANRLAVMDSLGVEINQDLDIRLIAGMAGEFNRHDLHKLCRRERAKVDITGFDEVLERLKSAYCRSFGELREREGISIFSLVRFLRPESKVDRYLLEFGNAQDTGRIAIFLNCKGEVCVRLVDESGTEYWLSGVVLPGASVCGEWLSIGAVFSWIGDSALMTLSLNGLIVDYREKRSGVVARLAGATFRL